MKRIIMVIPLAFILGGMIFGAMVAKVIIG